MTRVLFFIGLLATSLKCVSQDVSGPVPVKKEIISITGKVLDSITGKPLPYASVVLKNKSLGAVSNEVGEFVFNVPGNSLGDTVEFSVIGYDSRELPVKSLDIGKYAQVKLQQKGASLQLVTISAKKLLAADVVKKALDRLPANYSNANHILKGFFRDWKTVDFTGGTQDNGVLIEAAVNVIDPGYLKNNKKDQIFIQEMRRSELSGQAKWNYRNSLHTLLGTNYIKNNNTKEFSGKAAVLSFPNNFVFAFSSTSRDNDYFVVEASEANSDLVYTFYIRVFEYAIERIDLKSKREFIRGKWRIKAVDNTQRFRKWNGRWFLSYIRRSWQLENIDPRSGKINRKEDYNMEFLVNEIGATDNLQTSELGYLASEKKPLEFQVKEYNDSFWKSYNIIKENPLNPAIRKFFEKEKSLADQFKTSGQALTESLPGRALPEQFNAQSSWVFNRGDTLQGSLNEFRRCYDVYYYDLKVAIEPFKKMLSGTSNVYFVVKEPTRKIQIDLNPSLAISSIEGAGRQLPYSRAHNAVFIDLPDLLLPGSKQLISINYNGQPLEPDFRVPNYGAFIWSHDDQHNPWIQSICQGSGANGWWPNKDHLSDKADSVTLTVTVPSNLVCVSNGNLMSKEASLHTTTYRWKVINPILNYNISVNAGNYTSWDEKYSGASNVTISYYALRQDEVKAKEAFKIVPSAIKLYEKYFGPYPFPQDNFKIIQTPYPIEHQSCVSVGPAFEEELILHETAHEWWGNSVSCTDLADIWIHESFATYSVYLFNEKNKGEEQAIKYLDYLAGNVKSAFPMVGKYGVNDIHYNNIDAYSKGALLLHTLRNLIANDSVWFEILKGLQQDFKHSSITTRELVAYFNKKSNRDFEYLFNQFLYHIEVPKLELKLEQRSGSLKVEYRWKNAQTDFVMPVKVTVAKDFFEYLYPTSAWKEVQLESFKAADFKVETNRLIEVSTAVVQEN